MNLSKWLPVVAVMASLTLAAACGGDDGATVSQIDDGAEADSASGSGSASAPATGSTESTGVDAGYEYASNVDAHRLVVLDVCGIKDLLPSDADIDFDAVAALYSDGENSVNSDGSVRTIGGFASRDDRNPQYQEFFGSTTPLDDFVTSAIEGTGPFEGESDLVRRQGIEKGIQNQIMVAWTLHEFGAALEKGADGNFDAAEGAPHNWDEAWAFYHGAAGGCAPWATGNSRAGNFGTTGADGETAAANEMILEAMVAGRDALVGEDLAGAEAATADAQKGLAIIYSQASLRYAQVMEDDLAEGDDEAARIHQAEGWAFSRVLAPFLADNGADMAAIDAIYNLENEPDAGGYALIEEALTPAWDALGITAEDIGALE